MPGNITISSANIPEGTCPAWFTTEFWLHKVALLSANLNGAMNVFNYGNSVPAPADQSKPWIRTDAAGRIDKIYNYSGGAWIALHPDFPGKVVLWRGDISTIATLDGGEVGAVTATTGPMWARLTEMDGKFPLGIGDLPGGYTVAVDDTGGEENHVLVVAELPAHHHNVQVVSANIESGSESTRLRSDADTTQPEAVTDDTGSDLAHNNMPPWRGIGFIYRTNRTHYRI